MICNYHTHSSFCDGKNSPEELVKEAVKRGFSALGFSSHSYFECDKDFALKPQDVSKYIEEISRLKAKYKEKIEILCGIEQDYFSFEPTDRYDYVIGSVHYVLKDGVFISVDDTAEKLKNGIDKFYGGDFDKLACDYFATCEGIVDKTNADIIGHLDLVSKFSEKLNLKQSECYLSAAEKAVKKLVGYGKPFEINTGAVARGLKTVPYPSVEILEMIKSAGGKIILSSDCHDKNYLDFGFDTAVNLAKTVGFTRRSVIKDGEFSEIEL